MNILSTPRDHPDPDPTEIFINSLKQADIFEGMTHTQLQLVSMICHERVFNAHEVVFNEGANSDELYIVIQGEVEILVNPDLVSSKQSNPALVITVLRRGQSFGEMAMVDQGLRSATARAAQKNTQVLVIASDRLRHLCAEYPLFGYRLMANLAADLALKLRNTDLLLRLELVKTR